MIFCALRVVLPIMSIVEVFVIFIMAVILVMYIKSHYGEVGFVKSKLDQREYLVRQLPDKQQAADYLADINRDLVKLCRHMMAKYPNNKDVQQLYRNFNPEAVSEGSLESGYTSYSVNKGEKIILCIRQRDRSFVDKNVVMYVAIHELGHLMTPEIGHTDSFWNNFRFLLDEAIQIGIYKKADFKHAPQDYCGIKITSSVI